MATMPDGTPEIFTSIQGEGPRSGRLTTFARLSACNLYCTWCDTAYTWRWTATHPHADEKVYDRHEWQVKMSPRALVDAVLARGPRSVVFTGGEPMLQYRALFPVVDELRSAGLAIEFETNGTILPPTEFTARATLIVASPKLSNSGIARDDRIVVESLHGLVALEQTVLKLVVTGPEDFDEIVDLQREFAVDPSRIWIMPCGRSPEETARVGRRVIDRIISSGYNYSARLHLVLFGETQGT